MSLQLSGEQGRLLLALVRKTLKHQFVGGDTTTKPDDPALLSSAATFVTLKISGNLRGCIGNLEPVGPIWEGIRDNAINAALNDPRFPALKPEELDKVHVDISILSSPQPLTYSDPEELLKKLRPGIDGVIVGDGRRSATFLPQVWQQLSDPQQFLGHLCRKAGLSERAWREKKLEIQIYQVQCFAEED
ncbi:MAG: AmmeMemoRadiSam system protein A [Proteobacteria bacterium]|nr:AmmeMemoRadiSam system protein A [Pseudomonadota bacterium]